MPRFALERFHDVHLSSPLQNAVVDRASFAAVGVVVAEPASCFAFGGIAREMLALHEVLDASLEMKSELVIELVACAAARAGQSKDAFHVAARCAVMTSPTTSAYFAQRDSSDASCLRPRALRR